MPPSIVRCTRLLVPILAGASIACSSSSPTGPTGSPTGCTITISGAATGTSSCDAAPAAGYLASSGQTGYSITHVPSGSSATGTTVELFFSGIPTAGATYRSTDGGAKGTIDAIQDSSYWRATVAEGATTTGSYTLTLSSVTTLVSTTSEVLYTVHGTLRGTLVDSDGDAAPITISITF